MIRQAGRLPFDLQGHRGARGMWPENTLAGFAAAVDIGVTSIEMDVVLSRDGEAVVFHDLRLNPDLVRLDAAWIAAPGTALRDLTVAEIARFDVGRVRPGSALARRFPAQAAVDGARIPTLREALGMLRGRGVRADIEMKVAGDAAALVQAVLGAVDDAGGAVSVRSFDFAALRLMRAARPAMPVTWLTRAGVGPGAVLLEARDALGGEAGWRPVWAPDHRALTRRAVAAARQAGLAVTPWTVNAPGRMRRLLDWGVQGFCTDFPELGARLGGRPDIAF